jgi:hypothetical protein
MSMNPAALEAGIQLINFMFPVGLTLFFIGITALRWEYIYDIICSK